MATLTDEHISLLVKLAHGIVDNANGLQPLRDLEDHYIAEHRAQGKPVNELLLYGWRGDQNGKRTYRLTPFGASLLKEHLDGQANKQELRASADEEHDA